MRIWLKPEQMAAHNVSPAQVREALAENNFLAAPGSTKGALVQVNLTTNTDLHTVEDFKNLVIRQENNSLVRIGDVADVVLGAEDYNTEVRFSGQRAVFMGIFVLPNANSIDVIKRVRTEMEQIQKELPSGMTGLIAYDGTAYINTAINDVFVTLDGNAADRLRRHLPFPRLVALDHYPGRRDSDFADRRGLSRCRSSDSP